MKTTMKLFLFAFMVISLITTACSKDGETGPAGIAGTNGADGMDGTDGVNGADGVDGAAGQDGNANVTSVLFEDQTISDGTNVFAVPQLTQAIYDTGIVYAYVTVNGNDYWEVLPLSSSQQIILEIDRIAIGEITLRATFNQSNLRLRFVLVEGNLSGKTSSTDIKNMSYEEAMEYFGLDY